MKKSALFGILFFLLYQSLFSMKLEITPIVVNFNGVVAKENTIIAYGDYGSILVSNDNGNNWEQVRVFKRGEIINSFIEKNRIVAFNSVGDISISYDSGIKWHTLKNLSDTLLSVIKYSNGYFVRSRRKIITLTEDLKIQNEFSLFSKVLTSGDLYIKPNYLKSIAFYKNNLIVEMDSSNFIRFDMNLIPIDTLSLNKLDLFDSVYRYESGYMLYSDSNYLYLRIIAIFKNSPKTAGIIVTDIYRTKDFKTIEKFDSLVSLISVFKIINNKYYSLNIQRNTKYLKDSTKISNSELTIYLRDFTKHNNEFIVVGERKLIEKFNLKDSNLTVISDFSKFSPFLLPDKIDDSHFLFYSGNYQELYPSIYMSDPKCATIKPIIDNKWDSIYENRLNTYKFRFKYYDKNNGKIYFGGYQYAYGPSYIFITDNYCKSFTKKKLYHYFRFSNPIIMSFYYNAMSSINIQKRNDNFITSDGATLSPYNKKIYISLYSFNEDFEPISIFKDSNMVIDYVYSKDTVNFFVHCANTIDSTSEVKYTTNKGKEWNIVNKYPISLTHSYSKEININNKKYLALVHSNITKYPTILGCYLDVVDLENYNFHRISVWKPKGNDPEFGMYGISINSDENIVYIAFEDTLFYTDDIFDKSKWKYYIIPNNGKIVRPFKKFGNRFFARYVDNDIPWGNGLFWIKLKDSTTDVSDNHIEKRNYLYSFPPYPIPAQDKVNALIYWDTGVDIDNDKIDIIDIFGNKIGDRKDIIINKQTPYSGILTWNCSGVPNGIYFILINHGTEKRAVKVMVRK